MSDLYIKILSIISKPAKLNEIKEEIEETFDIELTIDDMCQMCVEDVVRKVKEAQYKEHLKEETK